MIMIQNIKKLKLIFVFGILLFAQRGIAQNAQSSIAETLQSIYRNYDSVKYLSFDVKFNYGSDTLLGKFDAEQMDGSFTMAGKKAKYRLGDIDFMQNDSFFLAVYNKDKLIMVDEPKTSNIGNQLPMRNQIDSLLQSYSSHYSISNFISSSDTGIIQLLRADSVAQFNKFSITYDNRSKLLYAVSYEFAEPAVFDSVVIESLKTASGSTQTPMQKKRFTIQYLNYHFDNYDEKVYDENNYIWFENGVCKPVARYDEYKIYYNKPIVNLSETPSP